MVSARFLLAAALATASAQEHVAAPHGGIDGRKVLGTLNSNEMAESVLQLTDAASSVGIGLEEHDQIAKLLDQTAQLVVTARTLVDNGGSREQGEELMKMANDMFRDVEDHIKKLDRVLNTEEGREEMMLRKKYEDHDLRKTRDDVDRQLDISRKMVEVEFIIKFPECVGEYLEWCLSKIKSDLAENEIPLSEIVVNQKRALSRESAGENYNKVVIITTLDGERVAGHNNDGMVYYPYKWNTAYGDLHKGPWNCVENSPADCCTMIMVSFPNEDMNGNQIECFFFHPLGSDMNPRDEERVIINNSTDGRVWEIPEMG